MKRFEAMTLVLGGCVLLSIGCVRRTITIQTAPDNARVFLNDEEIGTTPVTVDFTWYGDYDVIIRKDGYETLQTNWRLDAPWYQWPGIDFVAEALVPGTLHDTHERTFELEPAQQIDREELISDAKALRERTLQIDE